MNMNMTNAKERYKEYALIQNRLKEALYGTQINSVNVDAHERCAVYEILERIAKIALAHEIGDLDAHWKRIAEVAQFNIAEEF